MHFVKPCDDEVDDGFLGVLRQKKIGVVVPCHNEQKNIAIVTRTLPDYVDAIVVIDDKSTDDTAAIVEQEAEEDDRIVLIRHEVNQGVGGAIATGYEWCRDNGCDAAVVMAGDAQMDPAELPSLLKPLFEDGVNYAKGNRLIYQQARNIIPGVRFFGNAILSLLTKFASGYWHVADSQCGYTAVDRKVLQRVDWSHMYKRYGQPNDLLVTLNIQNFRVRDVPIRPVYNVGEVSGLNIRRVTFTISSILLRRGLQRLWLKYIVYDFHPLVLFFSFGCIMGVASLLFFLSVIVNWIDDGHAPILSTLAFLFSVSFSVNSFFFSMWMDMERNKHLR